MRLMCYQNRIVWLLAVLCILLIPSVLFAQQTDGLVVWHIDAKEGVSDAQADSVSGYLTSEVERMTGKRVVSEADIATMLKGEETRQRCGAEESGCMAEIGAALGVPQAVSGDLGRIGGYWVFNLRLVNVQNTKVISRVGRKIAGSVDDVIDTVPAAVAELFGIEEALGPSTPLIAAWSLIGSGAVLLGVGGLGTWQRMVATDGVNHARRFNEDSSAEEARHDIWQAIEITGYAVGGAAIATGITLWILDAVRPDLVRPESEQEAIAGVVPLPNGRGLVLTVNW